MAAAEEQVACLGEVLLCNQAKVVVAGKMGMFSHEVVIRHAVPDRKPFLFLFEALALADVMPGQHIAVADT